MQWIVKDSQGQIRGPFTTTEIMLEISGGLITGEEQIASYPGNDWFPISQEPEFYDRLLLVLSGAEVPEIEIPPPAPPKAPNQLNSTDQEEDSYKKGSDFSAENNKTELVPEANANADATELISESENTHEDKTRLVNQESDIELEDNFVVQESISEKSNVISMNKKRSHRGEKKSSSKKPSSQRAGRYKKSSADEEDVLELKDQKKVNRRAKANAIKKPLFALFALLLLAGIYFFFFSGTGAGPRNYIKFVQPARSNQPLLPQKAKALTGQAVGEYLKDNFEDYIKAQSLLAQSISGQWKDADSWALLCMTYYELWPFTRQGAEDLRVISFAAQSVSKVSPGSVNASTCKAVELITKGNIVEASTLTNTMLEAGGTTTPPIPFYYLKARLLTDPGEVATAISYARSAQSLWKEWIRVYVLEGEILAKARRFNEAANVFKRILTSRPNHVVSKMNYGLIQYRHFNHVDEAYEILRSAFAGKVVVNNELAARANLALAEISLRFQKQDDALTYAKRSFALDPSNTVAKNLIVKLAGQDTVPGIKVDVRQLISSGDQFYRANDYEEAFSQYKAAFELDRKNAMSAIKAAKSLWQLSLPGEAIEWLNEAIKSDYKLVEAYVLLAEYHALKYDFLSASKVLEKANKVSPKNFEVYRGFAKIEFLRNNPAGAISYCKNALKLYETDVNTHVLMAKSYLQLRDYSNAYSVSSTAIGLDSNDREAQITYAKALSGVEGYDSGIKYLSRLVQTYPVLLEYRMALADLLLEDERYDQARGVYQDIVNIDPKQKEAYLGLGKSYKALGQLQPSLDALLYAAVIDPSDAEPLFQTGMLYLQAGKYVQAQGQFERVLAVNKKYPLVRFYLGRAALLMGDYKEALEKAKEEKQINPNLPDSYILAAEAYLKIKEYSLCAREYQKAIKLQDLGAKNFVQVSICYRLGGNLEIAKKMLDRAADIESGYAEIWKERGALEETLGNTQEAVQNYKNYLILAPGASDRLVVQTRIQALQSR